jgi:3-hydroxyisobutyrate dehydrogenase-like beta-hydroxyacid dehydrogenase
MTDVTIIGLGQMGLALAGLMLKAGKTVSIWNRSAGKADTLVAAGAELADSPAAAVAASPITIICVADYDASHAILSSAGVPASLADRLIINVGTGGPEEAQAAETFVVGHGGRYLDGAIQAAPAQMGQEQTPILVSGSEAAFAEAEGYMRILGGNLLYLGSQIEAAAFMDLASLSYVYGAFAGFLHGVQIAETVGINVQTFGELVNNISPTFGAFFQHEGSVIQSGDFAISESPLRISTPAVDRILLASQELGINVEVPSLVNGWLRRAEAAGLADEEIAAVIKILRQRSA